MCGRNRSDLFRPHVSRPRGAEGVTTTNRRLRLSCRFVGISCRSARQNPQGARAAVLLAKVVQLICNWNTIELPMRPASEEGPPPLHRAKRDLPHRPFSCSAPGGRPRRRCGSAAVHKSPSIAERLRRWNAAPPHPPEGRITLIISIPFSNHLRDLRGEAARHSTLRVSAINGTRNFHEATRKHSRLRCRILQSANVLMCQ